MLMRSVFLLFLAVALTPFQAAAHKPSDSYLSLTVGETGIDGQWDIALRDLDHAIGLDGNGDGEITWGELLARHEAVSAYALARLYVDADGANCTLRPGEQLVDTHSDGAYSVLRFSVDCPQAPAALELDYSLLFDLDPQHRGLLRISHDGQIHTAILAPDNATRRFDLGRADWWRQGLDYLADGIWHIWIGFDHVLFLLTLLLPAALLRRAGAWQPVEHFSTAFVQVAKIVTAFTAAHSITLSLATLGAIELPSRLVESAIAASVIVAALNNVVPLVTRRLWLVAFGFGLVHGLGFASVLSNLGLSGGTLVLALLGFNLGVETGQLVIVAAFLPLIFALRAWTSYPRLALQFGSGLVAMIAVIWLMERAFDLPLL